MVEINHAQSLASPTREVLLVGPDRRRIARLAKALEPYGFDLGTVVCGPGPVDERVPKGAPKVIVVDAAPPVTVIHYDLLLLLWQRWERVPRIAVTAGRDPQILSACRALGIREFASDADVGAELAARVQRHLVAARAASGEAANGKKRIVCDAVRHTVTANGRSVPLTMREFQLYSCLAERRNMPVSQAEISRRVWGPRAASRPSIAAVGIYVLYLRRKLAKLGLARALRTVRGQGYMLVEGEGVL